MMQTATAMTSPVACSSSVAFGNGYKFTGKERDAESSLDMFGARYYGSSLGRFRPAPLFPGKLGVAGSRCCLAGNPLRLTELSSPPLASLE
jgi:RHS repeat-associated protein